MPQKEFTLDDLTRILLEGAGADEDVVLDEDILDKEFGDLGYESLALLETASRIEREYGIALDDDIFVQHPTPRTLIKAINTELAKLISA
ncbi:acyl carrier protein [Streptomyces cyaneofuscatus]|uniref:acyl carrier protein n=1 Tax=Streptomyces cyaneofuscatus TaxID=66883 RepID=UPI003665F2D6